MNTNPTEKNIPIKSPDPGVQPTPQPEPPKPHTPGGNGSSDPESDQYIGSVTGEEDKPSGKPPNPN